MFPRSLPPGSGGRGNGFHFGDCFFYDVTKLLLQVRTALGDAGQTNAVVSVGV